MSYDERLQKVKTSLSSYVKDQIRRRFQFCNEFYEWNYSTIKDAYVSFFQKEFTPYMNGVIENKLWFAAQNVGYAIQSFVKLTPHYTLEKLIVFVDTFMSMQFREFHNWCDEIMMAMPSSEYEGQKDL